ncbi:hypothetical protein GCM10010145_43180 [Streptomyces ruber]|uniref:Uncharacterized protein n=2 Tax=Streptomyces TaxID=1883 RepID=A0A918BIN6_9ACTN|nr:hypothetical protein GCM10010145_43180 [Streptomyces ruber]
MANGGPALVVRLDGWTAGRLDGWTAGRRDRRIMTFRVEDDRITGVCCVRNAEKLTRVGSGTPLAPR